MENCKRDCLSGWSVFSATSLGIYMGTLDSSIVNITLPSMVSSLSADLPTAQWVVSAYLLAVSGLLPILGRWGDIAGRKRIYTWGYLVFIFGSMLCAAALNIYFLILARVLQAFGAAMLIANGPALISESFPPSKLGRAFGMISTVVSLGLISGPTLGGVLLTAWSWRAVFWINIPLGILGYILASRILKDDKKHSRDVFDIFGASLFIIGMVSFLIVVSYGQRWGWTSGYVKAVSIVSIICFYLFCCHERKFPSPMLDLRLFENRPFTFGNLATIFAFMALFSNNILLPFFLQHILHKPPAQIGMLMAVLPLSMVFVAPISGYLSEKIDPRILTTLGMLIMTVALCYQGFYMTVNTSFYGVLAGQIMVGIGNGLFQSPNNSSVIRTVEKTRLGVANGVNTLVRHVGMVCGVSVAIAIFENVRLNIIAANPNGIENIAFITAFHSALFAAAACSFIAAVISANRKTLYQK